jgi:hypothetical protein
MSLPVIVGLLRKFASVIAKNICALGSKASPASVVGMPESRFRSSAMKSQKYKPAIAKTAKTAANDIRHERFALDLPIFVGIFGFKARPQLAQKAA